MVRTKGLAVSFSIVAEQPRWGRQTDSPVLRVSLWVFSPSSKMAPCLTGLFMSDQFAARDKRRDGSWKGRTQRAAHLCQEKRDKAVLLPIWDERPRCNEVSRGYQTNWSGNKSGYKRKGTVLLAQGKRKLADPVNLTTIIQKEYIKRLKILTNHPERSFRTRTWPIIFLSLFSVTQAIAKRHISHPY